ncbi:HTH-type transcriptional activator IlvY [Desulfobotulus sp. H1]|uniref:HTH-type transcriptional activator IlvY n=1 Tax=Desulfobotulus pelophilus TaxID=2823377 RepID=A0ABT3NA29_9BACT|nr:HTH-type transcriptional activator IlvY [Desulfobotulus pelophilus]MCW7754290.1 HTH-type transcriptional activator IlvY [Desulfobotulus pelophilus]
MHIEELELFLNLARTRHFQKASAQSNISPSALSRTIQRMENLLGEKLFERTNRSVSLTPAGIVFRSYAEQMLKTWKEGRQALSLEKGVISGELAIYCSVTAAYGILPDMLDGFRRQFPQVHIKLRTGDAESALEQLQKGDTDITIAALPEQMPEHIQSMHVASTPLVWIRSMKYEKDRDTVMNWDRTPLILPKQGIARKRFDRWRREMGIRPTIYAQVTGNEAIIAMVHLGCGVGLVPEMVLEKSPVHHTIETLDVSPPLKPYVIGICTHRRNLSNGVTLAFWNTAADYAVS